VIVRPPNISAEPRDYPDRLTLRDARQRYFDQNGFGDGGYDKSWVKLVAGPINLYFPNTASRVRAVRLHDLHHVLTGYDTTWTGESEIGGWELASGCRSYHAAWVLNLNALGVGLFVAPRATYRAFVRGRGTGNLYDGVFHDALLAKSVGEMRHALRLDRPAPRPSPASALAYVAYAVGGLLSLVGPLALVIAGLVWLLR